MKKSLKLPLFRELFLFISVNIIHLAVYLFIFKNIFLSFLLVIEIFYFFYLGGSFLSFLRLFYFTFIIFLLNSFFLEGEILLSIGFLKMTKEGLTRGAEMSLLLVGLLFTTNNALKKNKNFFIERLKVLSKNGLIFKSINYFFIFFERITLGKNIKSVIKSIFEIYNEEDSYITDRKILDNLSFDYYIYNAFFLITAGALFFIKI